ncbi:MAG: polysaccharide biosynthesis C-terminal domain-containing protein [Saprospiraceae bacterium]|uniref:Polysaccharide biosynthesis C-terminal domain-containing protein n=1 Tax=Candidatus Opimibacter skivensis TaxID=2982028 RepID=A0A9D7SXW0_9BACT|nr:polysaccharide biosynthesis C-terminal domain-containing protein [Candidatus Opimibacter skivensis]
MQWVLLYKNFINDSVRQVQFFMLCRQTGIILSSIVLARFLSVDSVGIIEMLMLCGYLMTFFWSDALVKGYLANQHLLNEKYFETTFLWLYFLGGLVTMLFLLAGRSFLVPLFTARSQLEGLELFALYQVLIIPVWIAPIIGLLKGQNTILVSLYVLIGPAFACFSSLQWLPGLQGALIGLFCYALVGFIWMMTKTQFIPNLRLKSILRIIWPATWPLILYAVSNGIARSFDAWLVARNFDTGTFAIFRYGAREFPLVLAFSAGLSTMMIPKLREFQSLGELRFRTTRLMHICYPIVAVFMFSSVPLFEFVFGIQYRSSAFIFNIYLLLTLTQLIFPQAIMTARQDTKILWYVSIAELAVNIVASILLMRSFGILGIVWGTLIAYIFEKIVLMFLLKSRYQIKPYAIMNIPVWIGYVLGLCSVFIISKWVFGI